MAAPLVDSHFHVWTRDMPLVETAWHKPPTDATPEQFCELLDQHGIVFGVIAAASLHGTYNDYSRLAIQNHKRLRATCNLETNTDYYTMRRMRDEGFVGVRFMFRGMPEQPDLSRAEYQMFLRRLADLDMHVHVLEFGRKLPPLIKAIEKAGVKLVIDHFGKPTPDLRTGCPGWKEVLAAVERGRTWVKISGVFRLEPPSTAPLYMADLMKVTDGHRLLWGSDWPFAAFEDKVTYASTLAAYDACVPDPVMRHKIDEAALRFFFT